MNKRLAWVGHCSVCEGLFTIDGGMTGTMVNHGFKRPGDGHLHGQCFGKAFQAYEVSCVGTEHYLEMVILPQKQAALKSLKHWNRPFDQFKGVVVQIQVQMEVDDKFIYYTQESCDVTLLPNHYEFKRAIERKRHAIEAELHSLEREAARCRALIDNWVPRDVETEERYIQRVTAEKKAAKETRALSAKWKQTWKYVAEAVNEHKRDTEKFASLGPFIRIPAKVARKKRIDKNPK